MICHGGASKAKRKEIWAQIQPGYKPFKSLHHAADNAAQFRLRFTLGAGAGGKDRLL